MAKTERRIADVSHARLRRGLPRPSGRPLLGQDVAGTFTPLEPIRQAGGKIVYAWAVAGDCDPAAIRSNTFTMEWPPRSD